MQPPTTLQPCRAAEVTVVTSTLVVRSGTRPELSVVVANKTDRPMRVLDVRNGRRSDLQDTYFELCIVDRRRVIDLSSVISDPGSISIWTTQLWRRQDASRSGHWATRSAERGARIGASQAAGGLPRLPQTW